MRWRFSGNRYATGPRLAGATLAGVAVLALLAAAIYIWLETHLDRVLRKGELTVLTVTGPTTYFENAGEPAGFEYDFAKAFADSLGVRLRVVTHRSVPRALAALQRGSGDLVAAALVPSDVANVPVRFTPPYGVSRQQVVYRLGSNWPQAPDDLVGREIEVPAQSRYVARLEEIRQAFPSLNWSESADKSPEELLALVWDGLLDITVADSQLISLNRQYFPELQVGFSLGEPEPIAWAFADNPDGSLFQAAAEFTAAYRKSGDLAQLLYRYFGPAAQASFSNMTVYQLRIENRLPKYQSFFQKAAKRYGFDWRLLAAVGYQESYWDPLATSFTGVRGLMMLVPATADEMGVKNRLDPQQSIDGGARYLRKIYDELPNSVPDPDRTWMALAAYNVGPAHLEDARAIAESLGKDPNRWNDVRQALPLLGEAKWSSRVRFGRARGHEPVMFVDRVRSYHDVLVRHDELQRNRNQTDALKLKVPAI